MRAAPRLIGYRLGATHERRLPTGIPAVTTSAAASSPAQEAQRRLDACSREIVPQDRAARHRRHRGHCDGVRHQGHRGRAMKRMVIIAGLAIAGLSVAACGSATHTTVVRVTQTVTATPAPAAPASSSAAPAAPASSSAAPVTTTAAPSAPAMSVAEQQAVESAQSYLNLGSGFSAESLLNQLTSSAGSGFTNANAEFAINYLKPDWDAQAVEAAKGYLNLGGFSHDSLIQQLTSNYGDGFTLAQAEYAVAKVGL
jgi:hypothetical protein